MDQLNRLKFPSKEIEERISPFLTLSKNQLEIEDLREASIEDMPHIYDAIINSKSINTILIVYTTSPEKFEWIAKAMRDCKTLLRIEVSAIGIHNNVMWFKNILIRPGSTLTQIALFDTMLDPSDILLISDGLKFNKSLTLLDLMGNDIGSEGSQHVSEALKANNTLKNLDIGSNNIGSEGCKWIGEALKVNNTLIKLNISRNNIEPDGFKLIADALQKNSTLTSLSMQGNYFFGNESCIYIRDMLMNNSTLLELDIGVDRITADGFVELGKGLAVNTSLMILKAQFNKCGFNISPEDSSFVPTTEGFRTVCEALENNNSLTELDLRPDYASMFPYLEKALTVNYSLCDLKAEANPGWYKVVPPESVQTAFQRNNRMKINTAIDMAIVVINIARQSDLTYKILPREIWITIFKFVRTTGVPSYENIANTIMRNIDRVIDIIKTNKKLKIKIVHNKADLDLT